MLYPLIFNPTFHYRIWGGNDLKKIHKDISQNNIGESWEISTVPNFVSIANNGNLKGQNLNEIIKKHGADLLGKSVFKRFGYEFPLLIKLLNSSEQLSVQVHPNDEYAKKNHNSFGKNEMWYVWEVNDNSEIIIGFNEGITKGKYLKSVKDGSIEEILHKIKPKKEEVFFIPAGRIHAIGKDTTIIEIQQTSDITYRIYDYNRIDKDGEKRELHTEQAAEVLDFSFIKNPSSIYYKNEDHSILVKTPYFTTNRIVLSNELILKNNDDSFRILICAEGKFEIIYNNDKKEIIERGQTILIPAILNDIKLNPIEKSILLEIHID